MHSNRFTFTNHGALLPRGEASRSALLNSQMSYRDLEEEGQPLILDGSAYLYNVPLLFDIHRIAVKNNIFLHRPGNIKF